MKDYLAEIGAIPVEYDAAKDPKPVKVVRTANIKVASSGEVASAPQPNIDAKYSPSNAPFIAIKTLNISEIIRITFLIDII